MKLKPIAEILKLTKEGVDKVLAPVRAARIKAQATLEEAKIDEQLVSIESEIHEICAFKEINFDSLISKLDKAAMLERRKKQYQKILGELFPS